jgi:hypothetical protein
VTAMKTCLAQWDSRDRKGRPKFDGGPRIEMRRSHSFMAVSWRAAFAVKSPLLENNKQILYCKNCNRPLKLCSRRAE